MEQLLRVAIQQSRILCVAAGAGAKAAAAGRAAEPAEASSVQTAACRCTSAAGAPGMLSHQGVAGQALCCNVHIAPSCKRRTPASWRIITPAYRYKVLVSSWTTWLNRAGQLCRPTAQSSTLPRPAAARPPRPTMQRLMQRRWTQLAPRHPQQQRQMLAAAAAALAVAAEAAATMAVAPMQRQQRPLTRSSRPAPAATASRPPAVVNLAGQLFGVRQHTWHPPCHCRPHCAAAPWPGASSHPT